jgi:glutamate/tyrosine decarboxylase-like PLP-dependent enzyme
MSRELEMSPEQFRSVSLQAIEIVERYFAELPNIPVMPVTTAQEVWNLLFESLPKTAMPWPAALAIVRDVVYPFSRHNGHPRFFGYITSPGTPVAAIADLLAAGLNANVTSWRSAPAAAAMEQLVIDWFKKIIGYATDSAGLLISGGSMANFSALAAARTSVASDLARVGRYEKPLRIYVSSEGHFSISKAARLLGIGSENVQHIPTDECFRIDVDKLEKRIQADSGAGLKPMCIVGTAGTVNTGAVDPIESLVDLATRYGLWLHVDGAYGGFAALAPSTKHLFSGIQHADSVSLDPHKWLYSSVGCGCILYRDPRIAAATFAEEAEYTRPVGLSAAESLAFWDYGPELSRPFRALPLWLQFKVYGAGLISTSIESNLACARYLATLIQGSDDFELLAPVQLSIVCFRFLPRFSTLDTGALNERILIELQRAGRSYLSNARLEGKFALRACVLNYRTTNQDMEGLLEDIRQAAQFVLSTTSVS